LTEKLNEFNYEIELIKEFCKSLEKNKIEYKLELAPGFPYHKSKIDIVIREKNRLIGIEAKIKGFMPVFAQALGNRVFTPYNSILIPKKPNEKQIKKLQENGIGLYYYDEVKQDFVKLLNPVKSEYTFKKYYKQLKRNWNKNKIGRKYHSRELPDNFKGLKSHSDKWEEVN